MALSITDSNPPSNEVQLLQNLFFESSSKDITLTAIPNFETAQLSFKHQMKCADGALNFFSNPFVTTKRLDLKYLKRGSMDEATSAWKKIKPENCNEGTVGFRHPTITSFFGVSLDPPAFVMEYMEGGDLSSYLNEPLGILGDLVRVLETLWRAVGVVTIQREVAEKTLKSVPLDLNLETLCHGSFQFEAIPKFKKWREMLDVCPRAGKKEKGEVELLENSVTRALNDFLKDPNDKRKNETVGEVIKDVSTLGRRHGSLVGLFLDVFF